MSDDDVSGKRVLRTDKDVFDFMTSDQETSYIFDLLTYAAYSEKKYRWMERYKDLNDRYPDQVEIERWISELPHEDLDEIRDIAVNFFDNAAKEYLSEEIEKRVKEERELALNSELLRSVDSIYRKSIETNSLSRQLLFSFVTAIIVPIVLGIVVVAAKSDFISVEKVTSFIDGKK